jgi:hypothetical protein
MPGCVDVEQPIVILSTDDISTCCKRHMQLVNNHNLWGGVRHLADGAVPGGGR